jgi:hypothetical protein
MHPLRQAFARPVRRPPARALFALAAGLTMLAAVLPVAAAPPAAPPAYPTPSPGCYEAVRNGTFEQVGSDWVLVSSPRPAEYQTSPNPVYEGARAMRTGIVDLPNVYSDSSVYQDLTLPANAAFITLSFWYYPQYESAPGAGALQYANIINVFNGQFVAQPLGVQRNDRTWLFQQYDLTAQRGQQIRLKFGTVNDGSGGRTAMWLDNVSVIICNVTPTPSGTPSPTGTVPTATPTSPTLTPVPTLPGGCTTELVQNPGFETDSTWLFGDTPVLPAYNSLVVHTGLRSMRLGIDPNLGPTFQNRVSFSSVQQPIFIPPHATTAQLRWWHFDRSEEPPTETPAVGQDRQQVVLLNPDGSTLAVLRNWRRNTATWLEDVVDLTPFRGRPFSLYFNAFNDGNGLRTWQFIDDVFINVCFPPATATPWPTPTPLPTWTPLPTATGTPIPPPTLAPSPIPPTPLIMSGMNLGGEPTVVVLQAQGQAQSQVQAQVQTLPTRRAIPAALPVVETPSFWLNRTPAEILTWAGVMLGALALIGLLALLIIQMTSRNRAP